GGAGQSESKRGERAAARQSHWCFPLKSRKECAVRRSPASLMEHRPSAAVFAVLTGRRARRDRPVELFKGRMIFSENRCPSRIKSGTSFFGIMRREPRGSMARSPLSVCGLLACVLLASPAAAQFGSIFRDEPPRPPADVPGGVQDQRYPQDPRYMPPSQQSYPNRPQRAPDQPPERPLPAPMNLPPSSRPGVGGIESAPLAPLPGTQVAPQPPPGAPPPPPFQPGRQRQAPPQPADTAPQPGDQITVEPPPQRIANPTAVFSGLDKVTGRIISFDVAIDETVQFGALQVTPRVCYSRPPTETPNTDAFVEV